MDEIYKLYGKLMEQFQQLEKNLELIIFSELRCDGNEQVVLEKKTTETDMKQINKSTLGKKVKTIKNCGFLQDMNDEIVLEYLTDKRNYFAHEFFIGKNFMSEEEIQKYRNELLIALKEIRVVGTAVRRLVFSFDSDKQ